MNNDLSVLVVAKAPVPGLAKTRLAADIGDEAAATIAAAALLDTLRAVAATGSRNRIVALTGEMADAVRRDEIRAALRGFTVIGQRGKGFAARLVHAHADAAAIAGGPVVQIGMDTPQVTPSLLRWAGREVHAGDATAVLGPAEDGGWWLLGVPDGSCAAALRHVPMSRQDTGARTVSALASRGVRCVAIPTLRDVDYASDLGPVASLCPRGSSFRAAVESLAAVAGNAEIPA